MTECSRCHEDFATTYSVSRWELCIKCLDALDYWIEEGA